MRSSVITANKDQTLDQAIAVEIERIEVQIAELKSIFNMAFAGEDGLDKGQFVFEAVFQEIEKEVGNLKSLDQQAEKSPNIERQLDFIFEKIKKNIESIVKKYIEDKQKHILFEKNGNRTQASTSKKTDLASYFKIKPTGSNASYSDFDVQKFLSLEFDTSKLELLKAIIDYYKILILQSSLLSQATFDEAVVNSDFKKIKTTFDQRYQELIRSKNAELKQELGPNVNGGKNNHDQFVAHAQETAYLEGEVQDKIKKTKEQFIKIINDKLPIFTLQLTHFIDRKKLLVKDDTENLTPEIRKIKAQNLREEKDKMVEDKARLLTEITRVKKILSHHLYLSDKGIASLPVLQEIDDRINDNISHARDIDDAEKKWAEITDLQVLYDITSLKLRKRLQAYFDALPKYKTEQEKIAKSVRDGLEKAGKVIKPWGAQPYMKDKNWEVALNLLEGKKKSIEPTPKKSGGWLGWMGWGKQIEQPVEEKVEKLEGGSAEETIFVTLHKQELQIEEKLNEYDLLLPKVELFKKQLSDNKEKDGVSIEKIQQINKLISKQKEIIEFAIFTRESKEACIDTDKLNRLIKQLEEIYSSMNYYLEHDNEFGNNIKPLKNLQIEINKLLFDINEIFKMLIISQYRAKQSYFKDQVKNLKSINEPLKKDAEKVNTSLSELRENCLNKLNDINHAAKRGELEGVKTDTTALLDVINQYEQQLINFDADAAGEELEALANTLCPTPSVARPGFFQRNKGKVLGLLIGFVAGFVIGAAIGLIIGTAFDRLAERRNKPIENIVPARLAPRAIFPTLPPEFALSDIPSISIQPDHSRGASSNGQVFVRKTPKPSPEPSPEPQRKEEGMEKKKQDTLELPKVSNHHATKFNSATGIVMQFLKALMREAIRIEWTSAGEVIIKQKIAEFDAVNKNPTNDELRAVFLKFPTEIKNVASKLKNDNPEFMKLNGFKKEKFGEHECLWDILQDDKNDLRPEFKAM